MVKVVVVLLLEIDETHHQDDGEAGNDHGKDAISVKSVVATDLRDKCNDQYGGGGTKTRKRSDTLDLALENVSGQSHGHRRGNDAAPCREIAISGSGKGRLKGQEAGPSEVPHQQELGDALSIDGVQVFSKNCHKDARQGEAYGNDRDGNRVSAATLPHRNGNQKNDRNRKHENQGELDVVNLGGQKFSWTGRTEAALTGLFQGIHGNTVFHVVSVIVVAVHHGERLNFFC
mmetsp:Transcript_265/g.536  ORF Transcript_265/g.536 Transcript_265/m.536 type:complete len:231 (+) Transcript_265:807-1499(+)